MSIEGPPGSMTLDANFGRAMHEALKGSSGVRVPRTYESWARAIREQQGYESALSSFLDSIAAAWREYYEATD